MMIVTLGDDLKLLRTRRFGFLTCLMWPYVEKPCDIAVDLLPGGGCTNSTEQVDFR
jgi:hypothetical protein